MILQTVSDQTLHDHLIHSQHETITILGRPVTISCFRDTWIMRLPQSLHTEHGSILRDRDYFEIVSDEGKHAFVRIFLHTEGCASFRRYAFRNNLYLLETEDSIQLSETENDHCIACVKKNHQITGQNIFLNGKQITETEIWEPASIVQYGLIRIILSDEMIAVNEQLNDCDLPAEEYHGMTCIRDPLVFERGTGWIRPTDVIIRLRQYNDEPDTDSRPMIYSAGPALTLSIVMTAAAVMNAFRGYQDGRTISELIPAMMMPLCMTLSILIWNPLQSRYERKRNRKRIRQKEETYLAYLETVSQSIDETLASNAKETDRFRPSYRRLCNMLSVHETLQRQRDTDTILIRCGDFPQAAVILDEEAHTSSERIHDALKQLKEAASKGKMSGYLTDLREYGCMEITGSENYILYILLQIILFFDPSVLSISLHTDANTSHMMPWLYEIPNLFHESGRRYFLNDQINCNEADLTVFLHHSEDKFTMKLQVTGTVPMKVIRENQGIAEVLDYLKNTRLSLQCELSSKVNMMHIISSLHAENREGNNNMTYGFSSFHSCETADEIRSQWQKTSVIEELSAIPGTDSSGRAVTMDLSERGCGPHGLVAGTTGSGKTELLITFILSLAVRYSPDELCFIIIDFKGGGLLNAFVKRDQCLPHVRGVLTNLEASEMKRVTVYFRKECERREHLFSVMSSETKQSVRDIRRYRMIQKNYDDYPILPELVIITDEFAELKKDHPEFLQELISIARIGRSLGIHLILSTQRPGGIVTEQIWSNARFKICMKVTEEHDSLEVLHTKDAAELKQPGEFVLMYDNIIQRGRAFYTAEPEPDGMCVQILNEQAETAEKIWLNLPDENEADRIVRLICEAAGTSSFESLWPAAMHQLREGDIHESRMPAGMIDDYENNEHIPVYACGQGILNLVISPDREETEGFLRALVRSASDAGMRILSELPLEETEIKDTLILIQNGEELFAGINGSEDILMIRGRCDASSAIWIFGSYSSSISYRVQNVSDRKICLSRTPAAEVNAFLGLCTGQTLPEKNGGLIYDGKTREFLYVTYS